MSGGGGASVGAIPAVAMTANIGMNGVAAVASGNQSATAIAIATNGAPHAADFVVNISDAAMRALALDVVSAAGSASAAQLNNDLTALALLAILERNRQQQDPLMSAALAIGAYLAIQTLGNA